MLTIAGAELSLDETNDFLWRDGFRKQGIYPPIAQARDFWRDRLIRGMPYKGK